VGGQQLDEKVQTLKNADWGGDAGKQGEICEGNREKNLKKSGQSDPFKKTAVKEGTPATKKCSILKKKREEKNH